jgi:hypothetical protein
VGNSVKPGHRVERGTDFSQSSCDELPAAAGLIAGRGQNVGIPHSISVVPATNGAVGQEATDVNGPRDELFIMFFVDGITGGPFYELGYKVSNFDKT